MCPNSRTSHLHTAITLQQQDSHNLIRLHSTVFTVPVYICHNQLQPQACQTAFSSQYSQYGALASVAHDALGQNT